VFRFSPHLKKSAPKPTSPSCIPSFTYTNDLFPSFVVPPPPRPFRFAGTLACYVPHITPCRIIFRHSAGSSFCNLGKVQIDRPASLPKLSFIFSNFLLRAPKMASFFALFLCHLFFDFLPLRYDVPAMLPTIDPFLCS